jgi:hypothetical protein
MSNSYPKDDTEFETIVIKEVRAEESSGGWSIKRADGFSFWVPKDSKIEPKVGMEARFYGKGIGFDVRGLFLDGQEVFYRTDEENKAKHRADTYCLTAKELLARWDSGQSIWSLEMGGLGPGYEQAIQVAAIEMAREGLDVPLEGPKEGHDAIWEEVCDRALKKHDEALGGLSGAMYGAAKWLSWKWVHGGGPAALADEAKKNQEPGEKDRMIQVSKGFPQAATPA